MRWPFSRGDRAASEPSRRPPTVEVPHRDWLKIPAIQPALPLIQRAADVDRFTAGSFASWRTPTVLARLAHSTADDAPIGLVSGVVVPKAEVSQPAGGRTQPAAAETSIALRSFPMPPTLEPPISLQDSGPEVCPNAEEERSTHELSPMQPPDVTPSVELQPFDGSPQVEGTTTSPDL